ncbi:MAG TPA: hypothetical protein V6C90_03290 [Coleofasciculaceae cyanobacterium]
MLEDWLDGSSGTATRFVSRHFAVGRGSQLTLPCLDKMVIQVVRRQYGINQAAVHLAADRLRRALEVLRCR